MADLLTSPCLIVLSGLPGTGKTTVARLLARRLGGFHLRVDTIEAALRRSSLEVHLAGDGGYVCAYAIAADNLFDTTVVIADCVNPVALSRNAWVDVAHTEGARLIEVELICSDELEHRRRVEQRTAEAQALPMPTWIQVTEREYELWSRDRVVIDTVDSDPSSSAETIRRLVR